MKFSVNADRWNMVSADLIKNIREKWQALSAEMDERRRRLWGSAEATALGYGGISAVARATGMTRITIQAGIRELQQRTDGAPKNQHNFPPRVRRVGGGRKSLMEKNPALLRALESLVESTTRGDPRSPLLWTCKSTRVLAREVCRQGHQASHATVADLLDKMGYSLQSNRKTKEGTSHPDRNVQFEHINTKVKAFQQRRQPVISVDTKKKELIGDFRNEGCEWRPKGDPYRVRVHDFRDADLGKAIPYGVYDVTENNGWVSVGTDHDTAEFAVQTIRQWWRQMGCQAYPDARELLITADSGGSNGSRIRLWKVVLQRLANETGLHISVCHFPPGTSKWNKIEHRMFCHITKNWRGRPLENHAVVVNLIGNTTTQKGLRIKSAIDTGRYPKGIKVSKKDLAQVRIEKDNFHGDWNYTIIPRQS